MAVALGAGSRGGHAGGAGPGVQWGNGGAHCPRSPGSPEVPSPPAAPRAALPGPAFATGAGASSEAARTSPPPGQAGDGPRGADPAIASLSGSAGGHHPRSPGCPGRGVHPAAGGGRPAFSPASLGGGGARSAPPPPPPPASAERSGHLGAGCNGAAFLGLTGLGEGGGRGLARSCGPRWPRKPPHHEGSAPALGLRL